MILMASPSSSYHQAMQTIICAKKRCNENEKRKVKTVLSTGVKHFNLCYFYWEKLNMVLN